MAMIPFAKRGPLWTHPHSLERELELALLGHMDAFEIDDFIDGLYDGVSIDLLESISDFGLYDFEDEPILTTKVSDFLPIFGMMIGWQEFASQRTGRAMREYNRNIDLPLLKNRFDEILLGVGDAIIGRARGAVVKAATEAAAHTTFNAETAKAWARKEVGERLASQARNEASMITAGFNSEVMLRTAREQHFSYYQWVTMGDDRVRESHELMDGRMCLFEDPTLMVETRSIMARPGGAVHLHPGEDWNCRCTAVPLDLDLYGPVDED